MNVWEVFPVRSPSNIPEGETSLDTALRNKGAIIGILIIAFKLSHYPRRTELLGSLSYEPRGNLSDLAGFIIRVISYYIKDFWGLEREFLAKFVWCAHIIVIILSGNHV